MTSQVVFESFFQKLKCELAVEDEIKEYISGLISEFYVPIGQQPIQQVIAPTGAKGGKKTGYGVFMGAKNAELKAANPEWSVRQKMIVAEWTKLTPLEKGVWNAQAGTSAPTTVPDLPKAKKGMNGWNLFIKETKLADKSATFTTSSVLWKALSKEVQETYKVRAKIPQPTITVNAPAMVAKIGMKKAF